MTQYHRYSNLYGNGICEVCGTYQTPESQTIDGVLTFDIANYGNALYVAKYTNEGHLFVLYPFV